jgi:hypothetical protein
MQRPDVHDVFRPAVVVKWKSAIHDGLNGTLSPRPTSGRDTEFRRRRRAKRQHTVDQTLKILEEVRQPGIAVPEVLRRHEERKGGLSPTRSGAESTL